MWNDLELVLCASHCKEVEEPMTSDQKQLVSDILPDSEHVSTKVEKAPGRFKKMFTKAA